MTPNRSELRKAHADRAGFTGFNFIRKPTAFGIAVEAVDQTLGALVVFVRSLREIIRISGSSGPEGTQADVPWHRVELQGEAVLRRKFWNVHLAGTAPSERGGRARARPAPPALLVREPF